jgi:hypothetical protein
VASKLKFKEMISQEEGLSYSKVKNQVELNLIAQHLSIKSDPQSKEQDNGNKNEEPAARHARTAKASRSPRQPPKPNMSKTFSIEQIRNCMDQTSEKLHKLKEQLVHKDIFVN